MENISKHAQFDELGRLIFRDFNKRRPFSSFLPGIGGLYGIPLWVFYTNRGQAIASFGVESKDHPIMEFQPANKAYQLTNLLGFRTFLKGDDWYSEPFSTSIGSQSQNNMYIGMNEVEIVETNPELGLEISVLYFNLLNEKFAGLVRQTSFRNIGATPQKFDILDGMPAFIPYGVDNGLLKHIGRTIEAWMQVINLEERTPFFRLRASAGDTSEVRTIDSGNFALGVANGNLLSPLVDPVTVFGTDTAFSYPHGLDHGISDLIQIPQITEGRTPCAFFGRAIELEPGEIESISSVYGFAADVNSVQEHRAAILAPDYFSKKRAEAQKFILDLTDPIATKSANPLFDAYARQTFLDNIMRGGWPELLADKYVYHVYSRKHGDPERDYNQFFLSAEYYSQGNSNFRDVNQNRRSDVFFQPHSGEFNIRLFMSLIQTDGYNPLVVKGTKFTIDPLLIEDVLDQVRQPDRLKPLLDGEFSPGKLLQAAIESGLRISVQEFLDKVMGQAKQHIQAEFGEGYWVDHWTYNLDLIESYLAIYPDKKAALLFESDPLPFYDSPNLVNSREKKFVLDHDRPRQRHAIIEDEEKQTLLDERIDQPNWVRTNYGRGEIFRVPLFSKLVMLAIIKFSTRDPFGLGIEMEAGRPGWCDALNGLPGLFGSSMPETIELLRLINFIISAIKEDARETALPLEIVDLFNLVMDQLSNQKSGFEYWDNVSNAREAYRKKTRMGVSGQLKQISPEELLTAFGELQNTLAGGIEQVVVENDGIPPTYFYYSLVEYQLTGEFDDQERPFVSPVRFEQNRMPLYLEGPVHYLKILEDPDDAQTLYQKVRYSALYDKKLGMYKLNASLQNEPHEIGRARAFSPGWLENESIWLHMSYKYLLEILNAGLYDQFFEEMKTNLVPFMDSDKYGRSPLENSSFIVSSAHPDSSIHGAGFVARLSGSTAEFLSIWEMMMIGKQPFRVENEGLTLRLQPILPGHFFTDEGKLTFNLLGDCSVTYTNLGRKTTYFPEVKVKKIILQLSKHETIIIESDSIPNPYAEMIRAGQIPAMELIID